MGLSKDERDKLNALWLAMKSAQSAPPTATGSSIDWKNRMSQPFSGGPFPKTTYVSKGRQVGKTQAMSDQIYAKDVRGRTLTQNDVFLKTCAECGFIAGVSTNCDTCGLIRLALKRPTSARVTDTAYFDSTTMPTLYPTLRRVLDTVELTLPANTPAHVVLDLASHVTLRKIDDYRCTFPYRHYDIVQGILLDHFGSVNEEDDTPRVDPNAPQELFIEYCGACRSRPTRGNQSTLCSACRGRGVMPSATLQGAFSRYDCNVCGGSGRVVTQATSDAYASAWYQGGWHVILPEKVLKDYFGVPVAKFDGDFHKALLAAPDITRAYKQLARQFHPDLNRAKDATAQFRKLREAFDALRDPVRRKRYEAGLKFQLAAKGVEKEVVFRVPKSCGRVTVRGTWTEAGWDGTYGGMNRNQVAQRNPTSRRLTVSEILEWHDVYREDGRVMCSTWNRGLGAWEKDDPFGKDGIKPFTVTWEDTSEFEINI